MVQKAAGSPAIPGTGFLDSFRLIRLYTSWYHMTNLITGT